MRPACPVDIRRDDDLDCPLTLNREDPYLWKPNANAALLDQSHKGEEESKGGEEGAQAETPKATKAKAHRSHRKATEQLEAQMAAELRDVKRQYEAALNQARRELAEALEAKNGAE